MAADLREQLQNSLGDAYRIERELGGGGMSRVFVAMETALGRRVVVKVLLPELAAGVSIERFRREITLAAQLSHPHIVPLLAAGDAEGLPWFTMPFVTGESLRARLIRDGELPVPDAVRTLRDVASALAYAHTQGVVHRDIKPDNVLLSHGVAVVTDFGVAKALTVSSSDLVARGASGITSLGMSLGTPAYMAPEQASADPAMDHRVDIYAFGITAYEILTGLPPFAGRTPQAMLGAHVIALPEPVAARRPGLPPLLESMVMRCLEKRPADRPQHAADLIAMLDMMTTPSGVMPPVHPPTVVMRPPLGVRARAWVRKHGLATAAVVGVAAAVGIAALTLGIAVPGRPETAEVPAVPAPGGVPAPEPMPAGIPESAAAAKAPAPVETAAPSAAPSPRREPAAERPMPTEASLLEGIRKDALAARGRAAAAGAEPAALARGDSAMALADSHARAGRTVQAAGRISAAVALWNAAAERRPETQAVAPAPPPAPTPAPAAPTPAPTAVPTPGPAGSTADAAPAQRPPSGLTPPAPPRPVDPSREIGALFETYALAIEARSLPAIRQVYPSIQPGQARDWEQFFEAVREIGVDLKITRLDVAGATGEAAVSGTYQFVDPSTRRERREDVSFVARLQREGDRWRIESIR